MNSFRYLISRTLVAFFLLSLFAFSPAVVSAKESSSDLPKVDLHGLWQMQSSCVDHSSGEAISTPGFAAKGWHSAEIPGTVVGALVSDKTLPDPNYAMNLKAFPGVVLNGERPFSNLDMPADSPFRCSHWFRLEFEAPREYASRQVWLHFLGINYRANIWVNGQKMATAPKSPGRIAPTSSTLQNLLPPSRTRSRSKCLRPRRVISASLGWIGIRRPPTRTWASGTRSFSPAAGTFLCGIRSFSPSWTRTTKPPR